MADPDRPTRITLLDTLRGVATLGILWMNVVSFGLVEGAYYNVSLGGADTPLAHAVGIAGEVFFDQKMMALFSMLFGAGIVLFAERVEARGGRALWRSLWRNLLLLGIGAVHAVLWVGDILSVYAICAPGLLLLRRRSDRTLLAVSAAAWGLVVALPFALQRLVPLTPEALGGVWFAGAAGGGPDADLVTLSIVADVFLRAFGAMTLGMVLYRSGALTGAWSTAAYRRMAAIGCGLGLPLAAAGTAWVVSSGYDPRLAFVGSVPNAVATVPVAFGYLGLVALFDRRAVTWWHERLRAVGRTALTNYLAQTVISLLVLRVLVNRGTFDRAELVVFVLGVQLTQLVVSHAWLQRFRQGPVEALWRRVTWWGPRPRGATST